MRLKTRPSIRRVTAAQASLPGFYRRELLCSDEPNLVHFLPGHKTDRSQDRQVTITTRRTTKQIDNRWLLYSGVALLFSAELPKMAKMQSWLHSGAIEWCEVGGTFSAERQTAISAQEAPTVPRIIIILHDIGYSRTFVLRTVSPQLLSQAQCYLTITVFFFLIQICVPSYYTSSQNEWPELTSGANDKSRV